MPKKIMPDTPDEFPDTHNTPEIISEPVPESIPIPEEEPVQIPSENPAPEIPEEQPDLPAEPGSL